MLCKKVLLFIFMLLFEQGLVYSQNNYLKKAKSYYIIDSNIYYGEKHLQRCLSNFNNTPEIIEAYTYLVSNYLNKEKFTKANSLVQAMLSLGYKLRDKEMEYVAIGLLGDVEKYSKNYSKAIDYYLKSYDLLEKSKNWNYLFKCAIDMVELNRAIANYKDAEIYIHKANSIFKTHQLRDSAMLARLYNRIAAVKNETGTLALIDTSIIYSKKSLVINQRLKNYNAEATTWNELGYSYRHLNKIDTAEACFKKAEEIWFSLGAANYAVNAINNRAAMYGYLHIKEKERQQLYFKIIEIVNKQNIDFDIHLVYKGLSEQYARFNDTKNALYYYQLYHNAYEKKLEKIYYAQIDEIKEKYESGKIKEKIHRVSNKLSLSEKILNQKNRENKLIYIILSVFVLLIVIIFYLLYRVNKNNKLLQSKNKEKDVLIQEVHHRVKNNLQFVSSLINMQMNSSHNETEIYSLNDASRRIRSMALVHEMLYNQDEIKGISIKHYITELTQSINDLINSKNLPIKFELQLDDIHFDITQATALGMITSELISNSIKYAFKNTSEPTITIFLQQNSNQNKLIYTVKDNGCGLKETSVGTNKLGMRLINIFSRQLKGEYTIINNNGLQYQIIFSL